MQRLGKPSTPDKAIVCQTTRSQADSEPCHNSIRLCPCCILWTFHWKGSIKPVAAKVEAVTKFPHQVNQHELMYFLRLAVIIESFERTSHL